MGGLLAGEPRVTIAWEDGAELTWVQEGLGFIGFIGFIGLIGFRV